MNQAVPPPQTHLSRVSFGPRGVGATSQGRSLCGTSWVKASEAWLRNRADLPLTKAWIGGCAPKVSGFWATLCPCSRSYSHSQPSIASGVS